MKTIEIQENSSPMNKVMVFLLSGKAGVGKTFTADFIRQAYASEGYSTINLPLAEGVKATATSMGWDGRKDTLGRSLLQTIGNAGRLYNIDTWVNMAISKYMNHPQYPIDIVTMDDWRYENEWRGVVNIPLFKVIALRINSPEREILKDNPEQYADTSEISLDNFEHFSYVLENPVNLPDTVTDSLCDIITTETLKNRR